MISPGYIGEPSFVEALAEYQSPGFVVKASDITDTLSIRLKNISVYNIYQPNRDRKGVIHPNKTGNNIILVGEKDIIYP